MSERLVLIGRVTGAFGVRGEVRILAYGEDPSALLAYRVLKRKDGRTALTLISGRAVKGELIARAQEVGVKEAADSLRGLELYVPRSVMPALEDEDDFYLADLLGLRVETLSGESLGVVKAVQNFGAGDLLEIEPKAGAAFYLPFTKAVVPEVRLAEGRILADPPQDVD